MQAALRWIDRKRYLWLMSPLVPILILWSLFNYQSTGIAAFAWGAPILIYVLIPLADWLIGTDASNPPEDAVDGLERDFYYRLIVLAYVPTQYAATIWGTWLAVHAASPWAYAGLVFSVGAVNGIGINTAHEFGHKADRWERWLAKLTLAPVAYGHFFVEHNLGHHRNVATPEDPASARIGESFWAFLPRSMIAGAASAWRIEKARLGRGGYGAWTWRNDNLQAWAMTVAFFAAVTLWLGWAALPFLLLQAFYGASLLEVVNYIEHYGLLRAKDAGGRYVRCNPQHSWNSNHLVTNLFLYQLQRHSDHHANPTRRFQALRHFDESPQLPAGYAAMLLPAYFPPLWFAWMDRRVAAHYGGDLTKANLQPGRREALLRRWSAT